MIHVLIMGTVNIAICDLHNYAKSFGNLGGGYKMARFHAVSRCLFLCSLFITYEGQLQLHLVTVFKKSENLSGRENMNKKKP